MLAIVLARKNFREFDQIITLFSAEKGKVDVLAKGVKKINSKNSSYLEPGFLLEVESISSREFVLLTKVEVVETFKNIRIDLNKIQTVNYILNFLNKIIKPNYKESSVFSTTVSFLNFCHKQQKISLILREAFIIKVICYLGFYPELDKCVVCGQGINKFEKDKYFFSWSLGGLVCCQSIVVNDDFIKIDYEILEFFKKLIIKDWTSINDLIIKKAGYQKIQTFIKNMVEYYLGFKQP